MTLIEDKNQYKTRDAYLVGLHSLLTAVSVVYRVVGHSKKATNQMAAIIKMRVSCCLHANSFLFIIARQNIYRRNITEGSPRTQTLVGPPRSFLSTRLVEIK